MDQFMAIERRRRNLRIVLFIIIVATLPFYCAGFLLWATAPQRNPIIVSSLTPTLPPLTRETPTRVTFPSLTPFGQIGLGTLPPPLVPTPGQFFPPPTRFLSPTPPGIIIPTLAATPTDVIIPTSTTAPTLTPLPTNTTEPPTPIPLPTDTPPPLDTDFDGIPDVVDLCPLIPAPGSLDGCPPTHTPTFTPTATATPTATFTLDLPTIDPGFATPIPPGS